MKIFPKFSANQNLSQLIYAIFVIMLIPAALAFNTLYLLNNVQRDMDFELNNKALLVESVIGIQSKEKIKDTQSLQRDLDEIIKKLPEVKALEVFTSPNNDLQSLITTSATTKSVADPTLNQLAWGNNDAYSKQLYANVGSSGDSERIWLVASPIHDVDGKKIGLINLYISASQIDQISSRTTRDSLIILIITIIIVMMLLVNHFRFFEMSILFKKLSELDKLKDDFISVASHELRTPLTAISGYTFVLMREPVIQTNEKLRKNLNAIEQSSQRLKNLVEDILDVSRIEQNRVNLELAQYDMREIINGVVAELLPLAKEKSIILEYKMYEQPLMVTCDKNKMIQIMTNLVGNAIKYTFKGEVSVYNQVTKSGIQTFVKDTGIGLSEEERSKLFTKFYRAYNDKTKDVPGTGLGLWITRQLIEKMSGKISVESMQNQGSQFIVTFPLPKNS